MYLNRVYGYKSYTYFLNSDENWVGPDSRQVQSMILCLGDDKANTKSDATRLVYVSKSLFNTGD